MSRTNKPFICTSYKTIKSFLDAYIKHINDHVAEHTDCETSLAILHNYIQILISFIEHLIEEKPVPEKDYIFSIRDIHSKAVEFLEIKELEMSASGVHVTKFISVMQAVYGFIVDFLISNSEYIATGKATIVDITLHADGSSDISSNTAPKDTNVH
jgi:hypothetical protein